MKKRLLQVVKIYIILLLVLISYYYINMYTGVFIPCVFRELTGFKCPGCGITHMFFDLINFRFKDAFYDNPLVFIYLPFIVAYFVYLSYLYIYNKKDNILVKMPKVYLAIVIIITIIYGIIRNVYNF